MILKLPCLIKVILMPLKPILLKNMERVRCAHCGSLEAFITHDNKYGGLRGHCPNCGANWPES